MKIKRSDINVNNREITELSEIPAGFELKRYVDNLEEFKTITSLTTFYLNNIVPKPENFIKFDLVNGDNVYDNIIIECVRDGLNGEHGPEGEKGESCNDGQNGKLLYPMGKWNPEITYTGSTQTTPFVMFGGVFFVLISEESIKGNAPADDKGEIRPEWVKMEQYEAIYTKLLVADNGLIGGSVYNGDYVFSKNGVNASGKTTESYSEFTNDIVNKIFTGGTVNASFTPNYLVDFNKGRAWFGNGNTIINENGGVYTNNFVEEVNSYYAYNVSSNTQPLHGKWDEKISGINYSYFSYGGDGEPVLNKVNGAIAYVKNISGLNSYIEYKFGVFEEKVCMSTKNFNLFNLRIKDSSINRKNVFYKGTIIIGMGCPTNILISFMDYNAPSGVIKPETYYNTIFYKAFGGSNRQLNFIFKWDGGYDETNTYKTGIIDFINENDFDEYIIESGISTVDLIENV